MKERNCYRVVFELQSALSIGAADTMQTDHDVVLDSRGMPLLPATSLAGLYRSHFDELKAMEIFGETVWLNRKELKDRLGPEQGTIIPGENDHTWDESAVRVYDGEWTAGNRTVAIRDGVALKDKVAIDKLKFDRQAVQAGATFVAHIEVTDTTRCSSDDIEGAIGAIHAGELRLGAKATRGFGRLAVQSCKRRSFGPGDVDAWLAFDLFGDEASPSWTAAEDITEQVQGASRAAGIELRLGLELRGGISIREYTTEPFQGEEATPNYSQMTVHGIKDEHGCEVPVIPGTSWAGAFRERYQRFAGCADEGDGEARMRKLFGHVDTGGGKGAIRVSRIVFDETPLVGGEWKTITRNAIDRFTGATLDKALYTEHSYFGGTTELVISIRQTDEFETKDFVPLVCTLADLHNGLLAVGGLTSVGRGLFRIRSAQLLVDGMNREGFQEALLAPCDQDARDELIAPDVQAVAQLFCKKAGEGHE